MTKKQLVSHFNYKMALIKTSVFTYANSLSTPSHHPCHSLFFSRDHLRSLSGIISGPGSFAVQFGDHLRSWDHLRTRTVLLLMIKMSQSAREKLNSYCKISIRAIYIIHTQQTLIPSFSREI